MERSIPGLKPEFVFMCVCLNNINNNNNNNNDNNNSNCNSFDIYVIILSYTRNVNLPFKKDFKFTELHTKTYFSFTLETVLKMVKVAKAEINLN